MRIRVLLVVPCLLAMFSLAAYAGNTTAPEATASRVGPAPARTLSTLNVSISGPGSITNGWECTWYSSVSGGTPPYTYHWSTTGMISSGPDGASYFAGYKAVSTWGSLDLLVTDALGRSRWAPSLIIEDSYDIPSNC